MSETKTSKTSEMLKHPNVEIAVKNFGPIAEANIDLRPLTVFVGPSNTGKTYFSTLIYALHGISEGFSRFPSRFLYKIFPALFQLETARIENETRAVVENLRKTHQQVKVADLSQRIKDTRQFRSPLKLSDLPQQTRDEVQSAIKDQEIFKDELKRCFDLNTIEELIQLTSNQHNEMKVLLRICEENQNLWYLNTKIFKSGITIDGLINENVVLRIDHRTRIKEILGPDDINFALSTQSRKFKKERFYLPAARSGIMQSHRVIASSLVERATRGGLTPLEVPTFSGIVADFMQQLILYEESKPPNEEMKHLAEAIESDILVGQILMKPTPSGYPEFLYRPREMGEDVRLTRAASMVSELAPLVLFLRGGIRPGDTLIIEEPEAHLHPGAQTEIAITLAGLVRAGVRVVVTTHSDWLLKEIANLIRIGELKKKDVPQVETMAPSNWLLSEEVGTWWFQKDGIIKHIPFDPTEGIEPKDYEDVAYKLYDRSVNLQDLLEKVNGG